jgi:hypothetical protein
MAKNALHLMATASATYDEPGRPLGEHGRKLWDRCLNEYEINDSAGLEMLLQCSEALDRLQEIRAQMRTSRANQKSINQLLKVEIQNRNFVTRTLQKLGLNLEPVKPMGRPVTPTSWIRPDADT